MSTFFFKYIVQHFRQRFQVVTWDYRGHGRTPAPPGPIESADLSIERAVQDLLVVLDALEVRGPVVLLGHSMGCQVIFEFARQAPDRVAALVPLFGTYEHPMDTFMDSAWSRPLFDRLVRAARSASRRANRLLLPLYDSPLAFPLGGRLGLMDRFYAGRVDIDQYLEHLSVMDPRVFLRTLSLAAEHSAADALPGIRVPTLVVASEKDLFTPLHRSYAMADAIPGAELLVLAEASHAAIVEHPDTINRRIDRFLRERLGVS